MSMVYLGPSQVMASTGPDQVMGRVGPDQSMDLCPLGLLILSRHTVKTVVSNNLIPKGRYMLSSVYLSEFEFNVV